MFSLPPFGLVVCVCVIERVRKLEATCHTALCLLCPSSLLVVLLLTTMVSEGLNFRFQIHIQALLVK